MLEPITKWRWCSIGFTPKTCVIECERFKEFTFGCHDCPYWLLIDESVILGKERGLNDE